MNTHKDWKGPGWYDKFIKDTKEHIGSGNYTSDYLSDNHMYTQREPPEPPKEELADGLYLIQGQDYKFQALKKGGKWESVGDTECMDNPETTDLSSVVCRIPVEPI